MGIAAPKDEGGAALSAQTGFLGLRRKASFFLSRAALLISYCRFSVVVVWKIMDFLNSTAGLAMFLIILLHNTFHLYNIPRKNLLYL